MPDFLIVGAMKSGTTSLYRDLSAHAQIFFPQDKEPGNLADEAVLSLRGRRQYAQLFSGARADQRCGEASTAYTKLPDIQGVPSRARAVSGEGLRVVYIVRNPIHRIVSHHHHEAADGEVDVPIGDAVRRYDRFVNYSSYAYQAEAWMEALGADHVLVLCFEHYIARRRDTINQVCEFLGLGPLADSAELGHIHNPSASKPVVTTGWRKVATSTAYRRVLRPFLSYDLRRRAREFLLPKSRVAIDAPTDATVRWLIDQLSADLERQVSLFGGGYRWWPEESLGLPSGR